MLHLRFHRRAPSNPTSPNPDHASWDPAALAPAQLVPQDGVPAPDIRPRPESAVPPQQQQLQREAPVLPPIASLPPITRVVSSESARSLEFAVTDESPPPEPALRDDIKPLPRSPYNEQSGFIGGLALQNYRREQQAARSQVSSQRANPNATAATSASSPGPSAPPPAPSSRPPPPPPARPIKAASSFVSPTELHNAPPTGKRPPGARMTSEPPSMSSAAAMQEPPKTKKGLPFLKNPMTTLLLRRKTNQNVPDLTLPLRKEPEGPMYDPRIRGTRVHDFSAPRKPVVPSTKAPSDTPDDTAHQGNDAPGAGAQSPAAPPPVPPKDAASRASRTPSSNSQTTLVNAASNKRYSDSPGVQFVGLPKSEESTPNRQSSSALSKDAVSRTGSRVSTKSSFSAIPKHMKSTSSRFSFDMIGAAEQEKLLEERHRQRQQDKTTDEPTGRRDSRFDEFDDDGFDYDAMNYDDDLEERIPGVNADLDEEEDFETANDPDNDQENFAGFVFQRSYPTSGLASPHSAGLLPTPRDANGEVIGYAMTQKTPELEKLLGNGEDRLLRQGSGVVLNEDSPTGLGIQGLGVEPNAPETNISPREKAHLDKDDELYFNDGLIHDFDGEGDGSAFDESIFDLNDTDQYGRPIPGLFANNLAQRNGEVDTKKRESGMTSRLSAQSNPSHSTAHTSLSVDGHHRLAEQHNRVEPCEPTPHTQDLEKTKTGVDEDTVVAYQAALAAAAHKAAASGKFHRDASPSSPNEATSPPNLRPGSSHSHIDMPGNELDDYENDDDDYAGLDDYELDDDAIIAEANASALANDSDGWYGQEFGFYSAPLQQTGHGPSSLTEENVYHYSHGGYFGPGGVNRSKSDRVVCREPNLTPITERSEYSNRNSFMSLGWPQVPNGGNTLQSPGLAQLAMAADDHDMSLSGLLRLRNKAWGGSQASASSSRDGSPFERNDTSSPWGQEMNNAGGGLPRRKNSAFSTYSQEDSLGPESESGSPTLTSMTMPNLQPSHNAPVPMSSSPNIYSNASPATSSLFSPSQLPTTFPPVSEDEEPASPESTKNTMEPFGKNMRPTVGIPSQQRSGMGHRPRGSADSISYIKQEESGETRWILERRRTAESGEIEILERETVGGGRI
ncbi:hypothetical protein GGR57DRAFT_352848 [Xylariaceae sp. FL1272]|nr:hypothetical protein GGR57DRAFT_352848 [Xylariaceae sp. FL1272]